ncbi:WavE lipopolysaccharide synthesis family protein [Photobacterium rosenbergii]|uniref:WavE lipopolysaccharide synthesis family protein n=1 Tax=Photobacterium rosenbergii TaxID=294936 RepID=UPI001C9A1E04|nr:WavE lipopolysaccharide synthesis family protein [Photobacterium rosenbergii]MBY5947412.1 WavE lipopolysaccharide synthesis family protein [Photobacterium rosenbergii]
MNSNKMRDKLISDEDITFVVQGPVRPETDHCLNSIRKYFPKSKIILSTWENELIDNLIFDELIMSKDPGSMDITIHNEIVAKENTNRQIISTLSGLNKVKSEYCVKLRSDNIITSKNFLSLFFEAQNYSRDAKYSFLENRVLVSSVNTVDPRSFIGFVYQVSDWFFFGKTRDVLNFWQQDIIENSEYYTNQSLVNYDKYRNGFNFGRFSAEQNITLGFLKKHYDFDCEHYRDHKKNNIDNTIKIILANFYCVEPKEIGFDFEKYSRFVKFNIRSFNDIKSYMGFWSTTITKKLWIIYYKELRNERKSFLEFLYVMSKRFVAHLLKIKSYS